MRESEDIGTYKKVASAERDTTLRVPLFALEEITRVVEEKVLHSGIKDDGV